MEHSGFLQRPRITAVIASLQAGGAQRNLLLLCEEFARRGYEVCLITSDPCATDFFPVPAAVRRVKAHPDAHLSCRWFELSAQLRRLKAMRRSVLIERPDLVISFIDTTNVSVLAALAGTRVPVVVSERVDPRFHSLSIRWRLLRWLLYPTAARVVLLAEASTVWARRFFPRWKYLSLPNPVHGRPRMLAAPRPAGRKRIVAAGRLHRQKGFDLLVDAFASVAAQFNEWDLVVCGDGPERGALEEQVECRGLSGRVALPGSLDDISAAFMQSDLFVFSSRYEGFGMALAEAMAAGLPVISFDCPSGPAVLIRDGVDGVLVPPEDVGALASAMRRLMGDPQERHRLAARAPEVSERFSPERIFGEWDRLIRDVLAEAS
jgi:GalNAc-alpha-(1->4)-GalNAc-alpha-(1->3)-diNAcBac-PP-undecaprenol alpha-1,4-N-acetyl-D-galactosaminyltransferase